MKIPNPTFDGLEPKKTRRLNDVLGELIKDIEKRSIHLLTGICGDPHRYLLPEDVVSDRFMLSKLQEAVDREHPLFSSIIHYPDGTTYLEVVYLEMAYPESTQNGFLRLPPTYNGKFQCRKDGRGVYRSI